MPYREINNVPIYFEDRGAGDPVVLLHHGFGCTGMWKEIAPALEEHGYRVVMYDRRGYGRSGKGADFEEFYRSGRFRDESVAEMSAFLDFLSVDSFHLVGQCEGGVIGVDYAARFPGKVRTLTVSSTQCYSPMPMPEFNRVKFTKGFHELEPELQAKLIEWHGEASAEPFFEMFRDRGGAYGTDFFDLRDDLSRVSCPALVLYPDRSFLFDLDQALAFYRYLPEGELAVFPGCGHNTYEHRPREYISTVLDFISRHVQEA